MNPYDVEINDIKMENNKLNDDIIDLKIPVTYLVKKNLIEDMLTTLPHLSTSHSIGSLVIKFSDKDFILSSQEFSKYSFMKYQVVPVLFLSDEIGRTNYIYVDDFDYVKEFNSNISGKSSSKFYPLFAITPGDNEVQINLDMTSLNIEYQFKVSISELKKYSKVAIKFLHKSEIESIIEKVYAMEEEHRKVKVMNLKSLLIIFISMSLSLTEESVVVNKEKLPDAVLKDLDNKKITISKLVESKPTLISFGF